MGIVTRINAVRQNNVSDLLNSLAKKTSTRTSSALNRTSNTTIANNKNKGSYNTVANNTISNSGQSTVANSAVSNSGQSTVANNTVSNPGQSTVANAGPSATSSIDAQYSLYQRLLAQQRQNAQDAYNRNKSAIDSMYNNSKSSITSAYGSGKSALDTSYASQQASLSKEREAANRQAYINKMEAERDLQQNLSAQGLSGGASESTLASLYNNYNNSRNNIEGDYTDNLTSLGNTYNASLADLESQYNQLLAALEQQKAQYEMQNENNLANMQTEAIGDYVNRVYQDQYNASSLAKQLELSKYQSALNSLDFKEMSASNAVDLVNYLQNTIVPTQTNNTNHSLTEDEATAWNNKVIAATNYVNSIGRNKISAQDLYSGLRNLGYSDDEITLFANNYL